MPDMQGRQRQLSREPRQLTAFRYWDVELLGVEMSYLVD